MPKRRKRVATRGRSSGSPGSLPAGRHSTAGSGGAPSQCAARCSPIAHHLITPAGVSFWLWPSPSPSPPTLRATHPRSPTTFKLPRQGALAQCSRVRADRISRHVPCTSCLHGLPDPERALSTFGRCPASPHNRRACPLRRCCSLKVESSGLWRHVRWTFLRCRRRWYVPDECRKQTRREARPGRVLRPPFPVSRFRPSAVHYLLGSKQPDALSVPAPLDTAISPGQRARRSL